MTDPLPQPAPRPSRWLPWRSAAVGWAVAVGFLVLGVPLFLRMPPWCDLTLYEMAARTVMAGGVHYRDVFDTNLPGFVWLLVGVRRAFGPSLLAVRVVDLVVVAAAVGVLWRLAKRAGAGKAQLAWLAAGAAALYPFTTEFCHAQRDVWMFLPAVAAVALRLRRTPARLFRQSFLEGVVWALGVWIKPHVVFPAAAVWLATAWRFTDDRRWRSARADLFGNLLGGLVVGGLGVGWLVATGTWPYFVDVFADWNPYYTQYIFSETGWRIVNHLTYLVPWMFPQPLALVLAACDVAAGGWSRPRWMGRLPRWLWTPPADAAQGLVRAALGGLLLGWVFQSLVIQRQFPYSHVAETLVTLAVFAVHRWAVVPLSLAYLAVSSTIYLAYVDGNQAVRARVDAIEKQVPQVWNFLPRPAIDADRLVEWPGCWKALDGADEAAREDRLALLKYRGHFPCISVEEADEVAGWLRARGATAADVICWHSSPHAVYLGLPGKPAFRFMHADTPLLSPVTYQMMRAELVEAAPRAKYVVSDLYRLFVPAQAALDRMREAGPDLLPPVVPAAARESFPYDQPMVFRSDGGLGRYIVHELKHPIAAVEYDPDRFNAELNINVWTRK